MQACAAHFTSHPVTIAAGATRQYAVLSLAPCQHQAQGFLTQLLLTHLPCLPSWPVWLRPSLYVNYTSDQAARATLCTW
jgi:hypothetical protein